VSGPHPLDVGHGRAPDEVSRKVRSFIGTELMSLEDGSSVTAQTRLLRGVADSLGVMNLILYLQEEFRLTFTEIEAAPENFRTVGDVERLVRRKLLSRTS